MEEGGSYHCSCIKVYAGTSRVDGKVLFFGLGGTDNTLLSIHLFCAALCVFV
jgi:hypothetical protein